jgi:hypothetical protein
MISSHSGSYRCRHLLGYSTVQFVPYGRFGGTYHHLQPDGSAARWFLARLIFTLKMEVILSSETSKSLYLTTWRNIREGSIEQR